jgi:hypothetical protein
VNSLEPMKWDAIPICFDIHPFCWSLRLFNDIVSTSEMKSKLDIMNSAGNACYHSVQNLSFLRLPP